MHLNGRLEAPLVDLAPKVAGRVVEVKVKEGERVKAGDLLMVLDLGDTALAVERDRHGVESARARLQDLSVGSRQAEIAAAKAEVADRRAALDLADARDAAAGVAAVEGGRHRARLRPGEDAARRAQAALRIAKRS